MGLSNKIKHSRFSRRAPATTNQTELFDLSEQLAHSSSRLEDRFWEHRLSENICRGLRECDERSLTTLLDHLQSSTSPAYEPTIDLIEFIAESHADHVPPELDALLVIIPLLVWSRFPIPSGNIPTSQLADLRVQFKAHVLASGTRLAFADYLYSPDQLPQSYSETFQLLQRLAPTALDDNDLKIDAHQLPETVSFLSDTRYVIGTVLTPRGGAIFRWQELETCHDAALSAWTDQGGAVLRRLLPACAVELVAPGAFHSSIRNADRASRAYSVKAGVAFLHTVLPSSAQKLSAVIGGYYERNLEEYRISLLEAGQNQVLHGIVWPLLEVEEENGDPLSQINLCLRENGIEQITIIDQRLPLEFCDDCGAPLYPNRDGEPSHVELPDDLMHSNPSQLH